MFSDDLQEKLNRKKMYEIEDLKIGDVLHYAFDYNYNTLFYIRLLYHFVRKTVFWNYCFEVSGKANTIFLFSSSYRERRDMLELLRGVASTVDNYIIMLSKKTWRVHLGFVRFIPLFFKWNNQLKEEVKNKKERWHYVDVIYGLYLEYQEHNAYLNQHRLSVHNLVTLYDAHCADCFFTQMYNSNNKMTITLQHGFFSAKHSEWAFKGSHSKKFIANSVYTLKEAQSCGINIDEKYVVGGLPSYISKDCNLKKKNNPLKVIGLILDGEPLHGNNVKLLSVLQNYCKGTEYDIKIKLHPTSKIEDYINIVDYSLGCEVYGKEISIVEFGEMIDVGVVCSSTALLEMYMQHIPTVVFLPEEKENSVYKALEELHFWDEESFSKQVEVISKDAMNIMQKYRLFFGCYDNVSDRYSKIFAEFGII